MFGNYGNNHPQNCFLIHNTKRYPPPLPPPTRTCALSHLFHFHSNVSSPLLPLPPPLPHTGTNTLTHSNTVLFLRCPVMPMFAQNVESVVAKLTKDPHGHVEEGKFIDASKLVSYCACQFWIAGNRYNPQRPKWLRKRGYSALKLIESFATEQKTCEITSQFCLILATFILKKSTSSNEHYLCHDFIVINLSLK